MDRNQKRGLHRPQQRYKQGTCVITLEFTIDLEIVHTPVKIEGICDVKEFNNNKSCQKFPTLNVKLQYINN